MAEVAESLLVRTADGADAERVCAYDNVALAERGSTFEMTPRVAEDFSRRIEAERFPFLVAEAGDEVIGWGEPRLLQRPPLLFGDRRVQR